MKKGAGTNLIELINLSINQTLSRTLLTSITTFFVVFILWIFGGGAVSDLAFTLVIFSHVAGSVFVTIDNESFCLFSLNCLPFLEVLNVRE